MQNDFFGNVSLQYGDAEFKLFFIQRPNEFNAKTDGLLHQHQYYEFHIAKTGSYNYQIGEDSICLAKGNGLIIAPNSAHNAVISGVNQYTFHSFFFSLTKTEGQCGFYRYFSSTLDNIIEKPFLVSPYLMQLSISFSNAAPPRDVKSTCVLKAQAAMFICALFNCINAFTVNGEPASVEKSTMETLLLLDTLVPDTRYTLQDIAQQIQYSQRHTARLIKKIYQKPLSILRKEAEDNYIQITK